MTQIKIKIGPYSQKEFQMKSFEGFEGEIFLRIEAKGVKEGYKNLQEPVQTGLFKSEKDSILSSLKQFGISQRGLASQQILDFYRQLKSRKADYCKTFTVSLTPKSRREEKSDEGLVSKLSQL